MVGPELIDNLGSVARACPDSAAGERRRREPAGEGRQAGGLAGGELGHRGCDEGGEAGEGAPRPPGRPDDRVQCPQAGEGKESDQEDYCIEGGLARPS